MPMRPLSSRTRAVLYALANGCTVKAASEQLKLSEGTVEYHIKRAKRLLGGRTLTHAVVLAMVTQQLPDKVRAVRDGELGLW